MNLCNTIYHYPKDYNELSAFENCYVHFEVIDTDRKNGFGCVSITRPTFPATTSSMSIVNFTRDGKKLIPLNTEHLNVNLCSPIIENPTIELPLKLRIISLLELISLKEYIFPINKKPTSLPFIYEENILRATKIDLLSREQIQNPDLVENELNSFRAVFKEINFKIAFMRIMCLANTIVLVDNPTPTPETLCEELNLKCLQLNLPGDNKNFIDDFDQVFLDDYIATTGIRFNKSTLLFEAT